MNPKYIITILLLLMCSGTASAAWMDGYNYRQPITLTGGASGAQTDYTLQLNATYDAHMQADFDDLRFTQADGTTLIDAWMESSTANYALVEVEFPTTPANGIDQTYYMYYNNASVGDSWDITAAFVFGDNFTRGDGTDIGTKWGEYGDGNWQIKDNTLYRPNVTTGSADIAAVKVTGSLLSATDIIVESRINVTQITGSDPHLGISVRSNNNTTNTHRGYMLSVHNTITTLQLLDKNVAWGSSDTTTQALNEWWNFELSVGGTAVKGRTWKVGTTKPTGWNVESTFSTQSSGYLLANSYMDGTTEQYYDDFRVRKYAANPPTYAFGAEEALDNVAPVWGNQSQNVSDISPGESVVLSANGQDATGLNYAWLSTNETGAWQNFTDVNANVDDYQMVTNVLLGTQDCCGTYRPTGYSEITGDYAKFLFHHTPHGTPGQVIAFRWYYPANNSWSADIVAFDDYPVDASTLTVINATRWLYTFRKISNNAIYDIWTSDAGATWSSPVANPFNGVTQGVRYILIDNDTSKVFVFWKPYSDTTHIHQKFFYLATETYGSDTVGWTCGANDGDDVSSEILYINNTYYIYPNYAGGVVKYMTSTDLLNWGSPISAGVTRYDGGWGYGVDYDDYCCYMIVQHTDRSTRFYSTNKSLIDDNSWTYRLDLNVANGGIATIKTINNTHVITSQQENAASTSYAMFVKTHTITEKKYGSPLKFSGSTNWNWANFTWSNSDYSDTIGWKICFNDTSGLTNCTDVMAFDITADTNDIPLAANTYGFLRKDVTAAQTFSTIAGGFAHEICFSWLNNSGECWESYWSGDAYNSDLSIPKNDAYFVLMDGTGETVSCGVRAAGNVAIPVGWYATYLGESTAKTLTQIKTDIQVDGDVTNLYTWDHNAGGTGAWVSVDVTPSHSVLPNQGILINNMGAPYNWDGTIS